MIITRKHIPRRTFLRGVGVTLALPLLDAMLPAQTPLAKTAAASNPRLGFVYLPHGAIMDQWTPTTEGSGFQFSRILQPLEPFRDRINVVSGLGNRAADTSAVHSLSPTTWLSGLRRASTLRQASQRTRSPPRGSDRTRFFHLSRLLRKIMRPYWVPVTATTAVFT
jgi:hypothetical protein